MVRCSFNKVPLWGQKQPATVCLSFKIRFAKWQKLTFRATRFWLLCTLTPFCGHTIIVVEIQQQAFHGKSQKLSKIPAEFKGMALHKHRKTLNKK